MTQLAVMTGENYRGYRIEVTRSDAATWQVMVFLRREGLSQPAEQDDRSYPSSKAALDAGRARIDRWLSD